jgi:hypothetical protein
MNFKKILIAILLISLAEHSFSQDVTQAVYVRYNIVGSYKLADWKQDDFEKQTAAYDFGYRIGYDNAFLSISYQHFHGISKPEDLASVNAYRQFDLYINTYSIGMGISIGQADRKLTFSPFLNLIFGDPVRIHSTSVYVDGLPSYGSENDYNGTYMGSVTLGLEPGLLVKFKLGSKIAIECEVSKSWANNIGAHMMDDKSLYKAFTGMTGIDSEVSDKFSATKLMVGISYTFFNNND